MQQISDKIDTDADFIRQFVISQPAGVRVVVQSSLGRAQAVAQIVLHLPTDVQVVDDLQQFPSRARLSMRGVRAPFGGGVSMTSGAHSNSPADSAAMAACHTSPEPL